MGPGSLSPAALRGAFFRAAVPAVVIFAGACGGGESFHLAGTVERKTLELAAPSSEVITEIAVTAGDEVAAGTVVVKLDTQVAEAELTAAEAGKAAAQAQLTEAEGELARVERLRRGGVATPQARDNAVRARDEALALVAEKDARIAQAQKQLEDLTLRTSADGVVDQLPFEVGERAPAGGVVAVVLAKEKPWVRVWLPARAVALLSGEADARVEVMGRKETFTGVLDRVAREPEFTPHYALTERESAHLVYETRILLEDAPPDLRPGLPAEVTLKISPRPPK